MLIVICMLRKQMVIRPLSPSVVTKYLCQLNDNFSKKKKMRSQKVMQLSTNFSSRFMLMVQMRLNVP